MKKKSALLIGATGLVGREVLQYLCEREEYAAIQVIARNSISFTHPKLHVLVKELELVEEGDLEIVDDFFCCLGTTIKKAGTKEAFELVDVEYPVKLAALAKKRGALHMLVISAIGANINSNVFYSQAKGKMEKYVTEIGLKRLSIFRPSLLVGEREEFRFGERIGEVVLNILSPFLIGPLKKYRAIDAKQVALSMVATALKENSPVVQVIASHQMMKIQFPVVVEEPALSREQLFDWNSRKGLFVDEEIVVEDDEVDVSFNWESRKDLFENDEDNLNDEITEEKGEGK